VSRPAWILAAVLLGVAVTAVLVIDLGGSDRGQVLQSSTSDARLQDLTPPPRVVRGSGPRDEPMPVPAGLAATVRRVERELRGVRQSGFVLGDPNAPISITEYGDPRCLECALIHRDVIPEVVRRYVAIGRASLRFRPWPLYGPRSEALGRAALAASRQGRYWDYLQVAFLRSTRRNPAEPPGRWASALGLDLARWRRDLGRRRWRIEMEATVSVAEAVHLPVMPVFLVRRTKGGAVTILAEPRSLDDFLLAIAQTEDLRGPA
jgi:hypothetical protein